MAKNYRRVQDLWQVRLLIARGQTTAADQILGGLLESALIAGVSMDDAGANRLAETRPKPTGADDLADEREANE